MPDQVLCLGTKCPQCGAMMYSSEIRDGRAIETEEVTGRDGKPRVKSHLQCPNPNCPSKQAGPPEEDE